MLLSKTLMFYKRRDVQKKIIEQAKDKEIAIRYTDYFGKRPDILMYENDVLDIAIKKATSFHCSEELWTSPLQLRTDIKKQEMDELRKGWDLILDIDCHHFIYSKLAAHLIVNILKEQGIKSVTCKFSGNKGFHIAVPFEAFPENINGISAKDLFPEAPRRIAYYLRDKLRPLLEKAILKFEKNNINGVSERTGIELKDLLKENPKKGSAIENNSSPKLNVDAFLEIDTILIAPRHLYRMPYSFHEKSGLVSVPVEINKILKFTKKDAEPENVDLTIPFLERKTAISGEAGQLFINAYDFYPKEEKSFVQKEYKLPEDAIREELFPPCIKLMLSGMQDGRKRALFTLMNFLRGAGWSILASEQKLYEWNKKNPEQLREVILKGQISQAKKQKELLPPHNCKRYYQDLGVCNPDSFCAKIKNPLQYAKIKDELERQSSKKNVRSKLSEEQKEMRRQYREKLKKQKHENDSAQN